MQIQSPMYLSDNVFVELGLVDLSDERKISMLDQMNQLIQKRVMLQLVGLLPDSATEQLEQVQGQGDEAVMETLTELVPNLAEVIVNEVEGVKAELRDVMTQQVV